MPEKMTVGKLERAVRTAQIRPADCVLFDYARRSASDWMIERVQRRLLADLGAHKGQRDIGPADVDMCSRYVHAAMVATGRWMIEMTIPFGRGISWRRKLSAGDRIMIVRPRGEHADDDRQAALRLMRSCVGVVYPARELLAYYLQSWLWGKLVRRKKFWEVFGVRRRDVCSGTVWAAWTRTGMVSPRVWDAYPEAWYPGRMAFDATAAAEDYLMCVTCFEVCENSDGKDGEA